MKKSRIISFLVTALLSPICLSGCNDLGSTRNSRRSNSTSASNHEHTYSSDWSADGTYHWHSSTCGHDVVSDKAEHTFTDVITPATNDAGGYTTHTCNICGYSYIDSETPQLIHHYSEDWSYDEVHHWHTCTDSGFENLKSDESVHTFTDVITPATYDAGGYTTHTCNICGYSYIDSETPQLIHHYSEDWSYDEVHHWHACIDEGYEDLFEDAKDHEMTTSIVSATNDDEGYTLYSCECGYSYKDSYTQATNKFIFQLNSDETGYGVYGYDGEAKDLVIPSTHNSLPVLSVGDGGFANDTHIESLTIPNSVTYIGWAAFRDCTSLTSIIIPNTVTSIDDYTFFYCTSLTSIIIPNTVTSIGGAAFDGCSSLTSIAIPDSVTSIGESAFGGCSSLTSIAIPDSVTSIDDHTFCDCTSLTSITIPDSVTSIGVEAFSRCTSLTSITIPNTVTSIGRGAFSRCTSLTSIAIPDSVTYIYEYTFSDCTSLTSVTIPDSVTSIRFSAFSGCTSLTSITIPNTVTYIGWAAFSGCSSLTSITIPDSVRFIDESAFSHCTSLTSITIPDSVTSIGLAAFDGCSSLTSIIIPNSATSIGDYAFEGCLSLSNAFYCGSPYDDLSIGSFNETLISALCYYSADEPTDASHRYWHYVDGVPTIW